MGEEGLEKLEKWVEVGKVVMDSGGQGYRVRTGGMDGGLAVKHSSVATAH